MPPPTIRPALPHEYDAIARVWMESWVSTGFGTASDLLLAQLRARVPLEVANGPDGTGVEQAVDGAGIEPEVVEHLLEFDDVGASERRLPEVKQASSRPVAGLHDLAPRDGTDESVSEETEALLEGPYGELSPLPEDAVHAPASQVEAESLQAGLEVNDLASPVSPTQRTHGPDRSPLCPRSVFEPANA